MTLGRREFNTLLGGAAAWPRTARAQQPGLPLIGVLTSAASAPLVPAFQVGLKEAGYIEGRNVAVEYHYQPADSQSYPSLAADLVRRRAAAIVTFTGAAALAAKAASSSIPIVFGYGQDPVKLGLVASFNRPGGNITGVTLMYRDLMSKRVGLLRELVPKATAIGLLEWPDAQNNNDTREEMRQLAQAEGWRLHVHSAGTEGEIDLAFATMSREQVPGVVVQGGPFFYGRGEQFAALEVRYGMPAIFTFRDITAAGGLISYGISIAEMFHLVGAYAGRILKGDKPADLPVQAPTKFELVINLKTAKALGLTVPPNVLAIADEVIE
jgi:putative ABC transport system substrate-binding protein